MLGRIIPGRLPSTVADINLINQRIAFNKRQLTLLSQKVTQGLMSEQEAAYRRLYLQGENEQLEQTKRSRRYATPSYRTPLDVFESTRRGGAAKKYNPDSNDDGLPKGYFGDDNGRPGGSIPSDWNAMPSENITVPKLPHQPGIHMGKWPKHWPGNHSPIITKALMQTLEVNGRQVLDPRREGFKLNLNLVDTQSGMATALQVKSQVSQLMEVAAVNPIFTAGDKRLISNVYSMINRQITFAEQIIKRREFTKPNPAKEFEKAKRQEIPTYPGLDDTKTGDRSPPKAIAPPSPSNPSVPSMPGRPSLPSLPGRPSFPSMPGKPSFPSLPGKPSFPSLPGRPSLPSMPGRPSFPSMPGRPSFPSMPGGSGRRTGTLMGLGALQAHDRASFLVHEQGMTPAQRASYLQAEREMTMARKRAGAKVDLTKQIREEPVTRPWQLQVTIPSASLQAISTLLEQELARANLSQEMFTQQLHTHIASTINSLPSGLRPRQQAEIILEAVMSKTTNASGLLKKDVKVDINRGATSPLTFEASDSISGVVGSLSGTRAALGRLLR